MRFIYFHVLYLLSYARTHAVFADVFSRLAGRGGSAGRWPQWDSWRRWVLPLVMCWDLHFCILRNFMYFMYTVEEFEMYVYCGIRMVVL